MKHKVGYNRLGRKASHRKSLHRNMTTSLFRYERIKTTKAKALAIRRTAEKMITRAKEDSVHNRRMITRDINDKEVVAKLFTDIGPRYSRRPGGYTRILKLGPRKGDAAEMVLLELVEEELPDKGKKSSKKKKVEAKEPAEKSHENELPDESQAGEEDSSKVQTDQASEQKTAEDTETNAIDETDENNVSESAQKVEKTEETEKAEEEDSEKQ